MSALTREIIELSKTLNAREVFSQMEGRAAYRTILDAVTQGRLAGQLPEKVKRGVTKSPYRRVSLRLSEDAIGRMKPEAQKRGMSVAGFAGLLVEQASYVSSAVLDDGK